tara:strand:+ start:913 stop:1554 length:642 start_codon:yes stop_codon:yes gene_type:complete
LKNFKAEAQELFDESRIAELADILSVEGHASIAAFESDLLDLCAHYREIISTLPCDLPDAPFNLSLTKRADWLESNVSKPAERLLSALEDDKQPMFSTWPYPLGVPGFRDNNILQAELRELQEMSVKLMRSLRGQQADDAGHSQEFRQELFIAIALLLRKHAPEVKPNRGVYDPELRRRVGVYVDAMRLIFHRITGTSENLDRLIRSEMINPF